MEKLQTEANNSKFNIFESALYNKSVSMPFIFHNNNIKAKKSHVLQRKTSWNKNKLLKLQSTMEIFKRLSKYENEFAVQTTIVQ